MKLRLGAVCGALVTVTALAGAQPAAAQFLPGECIVSNGGQLLTSTGNTATMGGSAGTERSRPDAQRFGHQVYIDHVLDFRFRSLTMDFVDCNLDARTAFMIGTGDVQPAVGIPRLVGYRIDVIDTRNRPNQVPDFYEITLSNGYTSGQQPVTQGNVLVEQSDDQG
jgi:hypothetical protein